MNAADSRSGIVTPAFGSAPLRQQRLGHRHLAGHRRAVQRRVTRLGHVGIGALLEQKQRDVFVVLDDRDDERRRAVGGGLIDVGAGGHEQADRFEVARHRGVKQRRESALGPRRIVVAVFWQLRDRDRLVLVDQQRRRGSFPTGAVMPLPVFLII